MTRIFRLKSDNSIKAATDYALETWPHAVKCVTNYQGVEKSPAHLWCIDHFGPCGSIVHRDARSEAHSVEIDADLGWANTGRHFLFRNPDHAFEFKMAWG